MKGHVVILTSPAARFKAKALIEAAPPGAVVQVRAAHRTADQNAKMWAMLSDVSTSKPDGRHHTPEVWKALFMNAAGYEVQFETGLNGEPFPIGFSSSKLSVDQMSDLITFIQQWGDERGVQWSNVEFRPMSHNGEIE